MASPSQLHAALQIVPSLEVIGCIPHPKHRYSLVFLGVPKSVPEESSLPHQDPPWAAPGPAMGYSSSCEDTWLIYSPFSSLSCPHVCFCSAGATVTSSFM